MRDSTSSHPQRHHPDATTQPPQIPTTSTTSSAELTSLRIRLRQALRQFHDFPCPGVVFEDISPIFADPSLHEDLSRALELHIQSKYESRDRPDVIVGLEARGFLFGPTLALRLGAAFVPVRKKGKLPGPTLKAQYQKEYGADEFEIQRDAIKPGQKVLVVDDIIATGGSAAAAGSLVKQAQGHLLGYLFLLEVAFLKGREKLGKPETPEEPETPVYTLLSSQERASIKDSS